MTCKYKVKIKDIQYNYKVQMTDIQSKYKFKVFCTGGNKELEEKVNTLYEAWPRVSGEGETITLNDTINTTMAIDLKGNTSQEGTPTPETPQDIHVVSGDNSIVVGNNVFDISTITPNSFIDNNGNIYASSASNVSDYIEVKENNIILSYDYTTLVSTNTRAYCWFDSNKNFISGHLYSPVNKKNTFSVVSGAKYIRFTYDKNISNIKVSNQSANYPISLGVENLWDTSKLQSGFLNQSGSYPTTNPSYPNARYRLVYLYKGQSITTYKSTLYGDFRIRYIDVDTNLIVGTIAVGDNNGYASSNVTYQGSFNNGTITALKDVILGLFDFSGNLAEATITYGTKIQTITDNPIELCKIGDYQDSIVKDNGKWYLNKQIGKVVLNGSENWFQNGTYPNVYGIDNFLTDATTTETRPMLSDYFTYGGLINSGSGSVAINKFYQWINMPKRLILGYNSTSLADFKTWMGNNNVEVIYPLATPTYTEITDSTLISQLEAIKEAESYSGQTNISQTNDDKPFILTAKALKDLSSL